MGRLYDAFIEVGPRFTGMGDIKRQGSKAGQEYGKALGEAAAKAAQANVRKLGEALASARSKEADAAGKVRVAEERLTEARNRSNAKASQITAAEEALASAQRKSASASDAASATSKNLDKARERVAKSAEGVGAAGGNRFTSGFRNSLAKFKADAAGKQIATRFGVGLNGALGSVVSRSAGVFAAGFAAIKTGGLIKDSVNLEATFSQTMNTMASVAKVPADQIKSLSDLALKMGADTTFSAGEAAGAMLELAKGGLSAATIQSGALEGTLTLAAAGGTDLATASTIASNALNTFGLSGKDMNAVAAALAGGANASSASVESLGEALSQVGPGATTAGLSLQDTVGVLSSFDAAGIKGSDAGTSLKTMLTRLVPQTDQAAAAMKDLGLKFTDANGKFLPITNIAEQLKEKLAGLSDEQRTTALSTIFGSDATRAATVLMKEGATGIGKYIKATQDQGAAQDVAKARMKGTAGAIESFKGSVETAKLQLGKLFAPAIQGGLGLLTKGINGLAPTAKRLGPAFKQLKFGVEGFASAFQGEGVTSDGFVGAMERIGATARTVFGFFKTEVIPRLKEFGGFLASGVVPAIKNFTGFLSDNKTLVGAFAVGIGAMVVAFKAYQLTVVAVAAVTKAWAAVQVAFNAIMNANPIGVIALALVGLAAGLVYAYKHSEKFRDIVNSAFGVVKTIVTGAIDGIKAGVGGLVTAFEATKNAIGTAFSAVGTALDAVKSAFSTGIQFIGSVWSKIVDVVMGPINIVLAVIAPVWARIAPILMLPFFIAKKVIDSVWEDIKKGFAITAGWVKDVFTVAWAIIKGVLVQPLIDGWHGIQKIWGYITAGFTTAKNWVTGVFSAGWSAVKGVLSGPVNVAKDALDKTLGKIRGALTAVKDWAVGVFSTGWAALKAILTKPINDAKAAISTVLGAGKTGIQSVFSKAVSGISTAWNKLQELAKIPIRFIINTVLNNGLIAGFNWIAGKFDAPKIPNIPLPKGFADGGRIPGRPSDTDNTWGNLNGRGIPLATGEFIVKARQASKHLPLLRAINDGQDGYANGGLLGNLKSAASTAYGAGKNFVGDVADFTKDAAGWLKKKFSGPLDRLKELGDSAFARVVKAVPRKIGDTIVGKAKALFKDFFGGGVSVGGPNSPPGSVVNFRGVRLNERTISMLLSAEKILGKSFHITQGSYSTRVAASGSTHAGGGAMDTDNAGAGWPQAQSVLRSVGFAAWWRHPWQGPWNDHIHSIARGDPSASPSARSQVQDYIRGGDGLGGRAAGGQIGSYADGAWRIFRDQLAMVHKDEMVVPAKTAGFLRELLPALSLHQLHEKHQAHTAHVAHVAHWNNISGRGRLLARARGTVAASGDVLSPSRLHPDDIRDLARALAGEIQANPPRVHLDGGLVDRQLTRRALSGGY